MAIGKRSRRCDCHYSLIELLRQFFRKSGCHTEPLKVTKTVSALLPRSGFFKGGLFNEGMHVPD